VVRALVLFVASVTAACLSRPPDPRGCSDGQAWGTARALPELASSGDELGPWLSRDRQDIWFSSTRQSFGLYHARWNAQVRTFDPPALVTTNPPVTIANAEPFLSDTQTTLWYSTDPVDTDVYAASRTTRSDPFGAGQRGTPGAIDSNLLDSGIDITEDGMTAVFTSARDGDIDLYLASWDSSNMAFVGATQIAALARPGLDCCGTLSADGTTLLFESDRDGHSTIWESVRSSRSAEFPAPHVFEPFVGSSSSDGQPQLIHDGSAVVFSSNRGGDNFDLYIVDRCTP